MLLIAVFSSFVLDQLSVIINVVPVFIYVTAIGFIKLFPIRFMPYKYKYTH